MEEVSLLSVNKRFREIEEIYRNNGTLILKAYDLENDRWVALKSAEDEYMAVARLNQYRKELLILNRFDCPSIVQGIDVVEEGIVALVLQYVEGVTLRQLIAEESLTYREKINIAVCLAGTVNEIHRQKVLHKDITPSNILWDRKRECTVILDFNISEVGRSQRISFTNVEGLKGTLAYISPEQTGRMNREIDYRSDYYTLGMTLYELFTGRLPFEEEDYLAIIHSHMAVMPEAPKRVVPGIPTLLSDIIMKLIAKNPADRYQSIEGLTADFDMLKSGDNGQVGFKDYSRIFQPAQGLFGREKVVEGLLSHYSSIKDGHPGNIIVSGVSGIGKSSVIKELYTPVTEDDGYFLEGKFDQYANNIPYEAFRTVFNTFISLKLTEDSRSTDAWRDSLLGELSGLGAVLTGFLPDLELLIGQQTPVVELSGIEEQNRFKTVIITFIRSLVSSGKPVVIFLDDMQWMDSASNQLLKELFDIDRLLIICAYRSDEVDGTHMFSRLIKEVEGAGIIINRVDVNRLNEEAVNDLLLSSGFDVSSSERYTSWVHKLTDGNPFYIHRLLNRLEAEEHIRYDLQRGFWLIEEAIIDRYEVSDNVAVFLGERISQETDNLRSLLSSASVIGSVFDFGILNAISGDEEEETMSSLLELVAGGYVYHQNGGVYSFAHDQIQQAAYDLMDEQVRRDIHIRVGEYLIYIWRGEGLKGRNLYMAGRHLQMAGDHIGKRIEWLSACEVLTAAAKQSVESAAYSDALSFYETLAAIIGDEGWSDDYEKTLAVYDSMVEVAYMASNHDMVEQLAQKIKSNTQDTLHMATVYQYEIQSLMGMQAYDKALPLMIEALGSVGLDVNLDFGDEQTGQAFTELAKRLGNRQVNDLIDLPVMDNNYRIASMRLLAGVMPLLFNMAPQLLAVVTIHMILVSLEHGNSKYSAYAYAFMGTLLCGVLKDYESGIDYGELSIALIHKMDAVDEIPKNYMLVSQHVFQFRDHLEKVIEMEEKAFRTGIETGDHTYAGFAGHGYCFNYYLAGNELAGTLEVFEDYTEAMVRIGQGTQELFQNIYMQGIWNLMYREELQWELQGKYFDERITLDEMKAQNHRTGLFVYYYMVMEIAYISGAYEKAIEAADALEAHLDGGTGLMHAVICYQYSSLSRLASYDSADDVTKEAYMAKVAENQKQLAPLKNSINYGHRYTIVAAELARIVGDYSEARMLYEEAIHLVDEYRYLKEEGVYRILTAAFYRSNGKRELARHYEISAGECLYAWGAKPLAAQFRISDRFKTNTAGEGSVYTLRGMTTEYDDRHNMEIHTILKFSQAIAKEIRYESLLKTMLYILLENAGATRAVITNIREDGKTIIAENTTNDSFGMTEVTDIADYSRIPHKVYNFAAGGRKVVRLDEVMKQGMFSEDPYLKAGEVRSLLCYPIVNQGKIIGVVYLENDLSTGVFSPKRTKVLTMLAAQIAISFENANVYQRLETMVNDRTRDLNQTNEELQLLNEKLRYMSVTDGLTGLFNRRKLDDELLIEVERSHRYGTPLSVILLDIDFFKRINDNYGHHIGDRVLVQTGSILKDRIRVSDILGRWGGEEFLIVCPETALEGAVLLAEELRQYVALTDEIPSERVTCSFGVAQLQAEETVTDLLVRVDHRLYESKENGRDQVSY